MKRLLIVALLVTTVACGKDNSPTAPTTSSSTSTPTTPAAPTLTSVTVGAGPCSDGGSCQLPGPFGLNAIAHFSDNTTRDVTAQANWQSGNGSVATVNGNGVVTPHGNGGTADVTAIYQGKQGGVTVIVPAPWTMSGTGDTVFTMPSYVSRVAVTATYGGSCQNFAVNVSGRLIINVIIGTCSVADTRSPFNGMYAVIGGTTQITISTGVSWRFTEVRP